MDPYYLTHKAEAVGYHPQVVLAGRRINDGMGHWVAEQLVLELARRRQRVVGSQVLVLGLSFKEDCPDLRNTKVVDVLTALREYGMEPRVVDPWVDPEEARREYGLEVWQQQLEPGGVLLDLKGIVPRQLEPLRL